MIYPGVDEAAIKAQARAAVNKYTDVNDACPYPFGAEAGRIFRAEFLWMKTSIAALQRIGPLQERGR